eukprot:gnl/MRDRNA2_/MRDRNA2_90727_c0_seq1.p1 gnl/MRDRNA2_/MRDRNA2_90727_c0~~gnl/MRDRNA2_/MRDRNA2_90727_c0_seq1.p1  ORF type:complete len:419 (+),score=59.29 gnl/MRDRNA2_/MRDRNA2_90727_c0_seq1:107-1363(+)
MRGSLTIVVHTLVSWACAEKLAANRNNDAQDYMDKLVDQLANRRLFEWNGDTTGLDDTMLAKGSGTLTMPNAHHHLVKPVHRVVRPVPGVARPDHRVVWASQPSVHAVLRQVTASAEPEVKAPSQPEAKSPSEPEVIQDFSFDGVKAPNEPEVIQASSTEPEVKPSAEPDAIQEVTASADSDVPKVIESPGEPAEPDLDTEWPAVPTTEPLPEEYISAASAFAAAKKYLYEVKMKQEKEDEASKDKEVVKELVEKASQFAVLSTFSAFGYPSGTMAGFILDPQGVPYTYLPQNSPHVANLEKDKRMSLSLMLENSKPGDVAGFTFTGTMSKLPQDGAYKHVYQQVHKNAFRGARAQQEALCYRMDSMAIMEYSDGTFSGNITGQNYLKAYETQENNPRQRPWNDLKRNSRPGGQGGQR